MEKTTTIINGKKIAEEFCESLKIRADELKKHRIFPRIALINASADPASEIYLSKKEKLAISIGIKSDIYKFQPGTSAASIAKLIEKLNKNNDVHAILLQSPLAPGLRFRELVDLISPDKDVDGLTSANQGKLALGEPSIVPCTPLAVLHLIKTVHEQTKGLHAVILGRSQIVGRPLASLLLNEDFSVTTLHSYSRDVVEICQTADVLISAVGIPKFLNGDFLRRGVRISRENIAWYFLLGLSKFFGINETVLKPAVTIIDVGINRIVTPEGNKKIVGDVDFDEVSKIVRAITPVPNGVGPMTVAYLMANTIQLAERQKK